jgi:pyruvate/2-oxoglutarate dehydrogenase complex dihydrolipoamide acyltransferase (E2) component
MSLIEIKVPDIGDFSEVAVIELLVKPGDTIKAEQSLITVESDKASMEIPSSHAGVVKELKVKLGDKVAEGSVVLLLEAAGAQTAAPAAPAAPVSEQKKPSPSASGSQPAISNESSPGPVASQPSAARPTWNATCWCSAAAPAATRRRSAQQTSA